MGQRTIAVCLAGAMGTAWAAPASATHETAPAVLPLRSVVLYESGVGYFERRGPVQRHAPLALLVPQNHLDDALMTLVVLTTDGARVGAMTFPSVLAPEAALAESPAPLDTFVQNGPILPLIEALSGLDAKLVTAGGEHLSGRVIGVGRVEEPAPPAASGSTAPAANGNASAGMIQVPVVVFLTDDGAMRWLHLPDVASVGPADAAAQAALDRAVAALAQRRGEAQESVGVAVGEGGDLAIGYLAEAPVWRVSYRMIFQNGKARVQGWALVHNDTDEDWRDVDVELVEGQPNSYLFPFVTPRFRAREVLPPEEGLETAPQLAGTNADQLAANSSGGFGYGAAGAWGEGMGMGYGYGGMGMIGTGMGGGGAEASQLLQVGELATEAQATPEQRRELLSYHATEPLSLRAHESALVPVIDAVVSASRISLVDESQNVLAAIKLRNDTGYALREGPLAIFDGGFSGQTWLPRMYVDDARVLPHGADLDVVVSLDDTASTEEPRIVRWYRPRPREGGLERLEEHYLYSTKWSYTLTSHASGERTVCLRLPHLTNGRVTSGGSVELLTAEDGADYYHLCVQLAAGAEQPQEITTEEGLQRNWGTDALTEETVRSLADDERLAQATRAVLSRAADELAAAEARQHDIGQRQADITTTSNEIARHRADLAALVGAGADEDVATGIAEQMVDAGKRLDTLNAQIAALQAESDAAHARAVDILRGLAGS